jgi:hypothetical protein
MVATSTNLQRQARLLEKSRKDYGFAASFDHDFLFMMLC